jgi:hypothetical protein
MTSEQAQRLQSEWQGKGDQACDHAILSKEISKQPTGTEPYFCIVCGAPMRLQPFRPQSHCPSDILPVDELPGSRPQQDDV